MKQVIHTIKIDGGFEAPSITICGRRGKRFAYGSDWYVSDNGPFLAVLASDTTRGATCEKCRSIAKTKRSKI